MSGKVDVLFDNLGGPVPQMVRAGQLRALGVNHLIDYRTEDFEQRARQITGGRGVELILDPVGGDSFKKGYRLLAPTGRLGMFGASSAATGKARTIDELRKDLDVAYSPVNRNSACHGPSRWTTSQ